MSIPDQLKFTTPAIAILAPAVSVPATVIPARTAQISSIDFSKIRWEDQPGAGILTAKLPSSVEEFRRVVVMGPGAKTPYNPEWTEDEARAAFLHHFDLPTTGWA